MDSTNFRVLNNLGNLYRKLNKLDRAIDYYKLSIKNKPGNNYNRFWVYKF